MAEVLRAFDLVRVPLSELHGWLEERGLVACEHSVDWGERIVVEVRDEMGDRQELCWTDRGHRTRPGAA